MREIAVLRRQGNVDVMVVAGDHQRNIDGIESGKLQDHRFLGDIHHGADIKSVIVGTRDGTHRMVREHGIGLDPVPSARIHRIVLIHRELVVHVELLIFTEN